MTTTENLARRRGQAVAVQASSVEVYNRACRPLCVLDNVVREPSGDSRPGGLASA